MSNNFRDILPGPEWRLVGGIGERDAYSHAELSLGVPHVREFVDGWNARSAEPFVGVTSDGTVIPDLYALEPNGAPSAEMVSAARHLLSVASSKERESLTLPIDSPDWRQWSNPEFYVCRHGLRLEEVGVEVRQAILDVLRASMSEKGFHKAEACMLMNDFLGTLVGGPLVLNEFSYNFSLFGEPDEELPWGWQLFGHHLSLNCLVIGEQMIISPSFMGAEPNVIDEGEHAGLTIFNEEEAAGLAMMRSLPEAVRDRAQIYKQMIDPSMPEGRLHVADQRHLGGAFHDNRVIPYEGVLASEMSAHQRDALVELASLFVDYLPGGPLAARLAQIEQHLDDTHFCWIGPFGDDDPFYFRIQSPVVMIEFDHHSGVFLTNLEPAKCHIHTIVRTPNGNDYGKALLAQFAAFHRPVNSGAGQRSLS
jgi:Protein of unknown function (DUF3500)